jgi:hypothetical protein
VGSSWVLELDEVDVGAKPAVTVTMTKKETKPALQTATATATYQQTAQYLNNPSLNPRGAFASVVNRALAANQGTVSARPSSMRVPLSPEPLPYQAPPQQPQAKPQKLQDTLPWQKEQESKDTRQKPENVLPWQKELKEPKDNRDNRKTIDWVLGMWSFISLRVDSKLFCFQISSRKTR